MGKWLRTADGGAVRKSSISCLQVTQEIVDRWIIVAWITGDETTAELEGEYETNKEAKRKVTALLKEME
jgi:hypothetical protein